jgi:hypothetical protein
MAPGHQSAVTEFSMQWFQTCLKKRKRKKKSPNRDKKKTKTQNKKENPLRTGCGSAQVCSFSYSEGQAQEFGAT